MGGQRSDHRQEPEHLPGVRRERGRRDQRCECELQRHRWQLDDRRRRLCDLQLHLHVLGRAGRLQPDQYGDGDLDHVRLPEQQRLRNGERQLGNDDAVAGGRERVGERPAGQRVAPYVHLHGCQPVLVQLLAHGVRRRPAPAPSTTTRPRSPRPGTTGSDETVTVCVGKDLTVSKTAAGTFDRTYLWSIDKNVDETLVKIAAGRLLRVHLHGRRRPDRHQRRRLDARAARSRSANPNDWQDDHPDQPRRRRRQRRCLHRRRRPVRGPEERLARRRLHLLLRRGTHQLQRHEHRDRDLGRGTGLHPDRLRLRRARPFTLAQLGSTNKTIHVSDDKLASEDYLGTVTATDARRSPPRRSPTSGRSRASPAPAPSTTTRPRSRRPSSPTRRRSTVCVGKDLTVSKTAAGTFNRTLPLVDRQERRQDPGQDRAGRLLRPSPTRSTSTRPASATPAGRSAARSRSATPTTGRTITLTSLADVVDNGGVCTVAAGPYVVPKSGSLDVAYTCSYATAPTSYSGTNTATATWDKAVALHPDRLRLRRRRPSPWPSWAAPTRPSTSATTARRRGLPRQRDGHRQRAVRHRRRSPTSGRSRASPAPAPSTTTRPRSPRPAVRHGDRHGLRRQGPDRHQDGRGHVRPDATSGRSTRTSTRPWSRSPQGGSYDLQLHGRRRADRHQRRRLDARRHDHRSANPNDWQAITLDQPRRRRRQRRCLHRRRPARTWSRPERLARRRLHLLLRRGTQQLQRHEHRHRDLEQGDGLHPDRHGLRREGVHAGPAGQHEQDHPRHRRRTAATSAR